MATYGVRTTEQPPISVIDEVLGNKDGCTGRQSVSDLAVQLLASGALADAIATLQSATGEAASLLDLSTLLAKDGAVSDALAALEGATAYAAILKATWSDLSALSGSADGQHGEVDASDTGIHAQATATGYDGDTVANSGVYSWNATWSRWVRISDTAIDRLTTTMGDQVGFETLDFGASEANGASYDARAMTLTIPSGQTGDNALLLPTWDVDGAGWSGRQIRIVTEYETSASFDRLPDKTFFRVFLANGTNEFRTTSATITTEADGTLWRATFVYTMQGDEIQVQPYAQLDGSGGAAGSDQTIALRQFVPEFLTSNDDVLTRTDVAMAERERQFMPAPRVLRYATDLKAAVHDEIITVSPGGGADFTAVADAIAAVGVSGVGARWMIDIAPGIYEEAVELQPGDYVDLIGRGPRDCIVKFFQPDSTSGLDIDTDSVLRLQRNTRVEGLGLWGQNVRYAVHPEIPLSGSIDNPIWEIVNCDIRHFGNPSPNNYRGQTSQNAIGSGTNSGQMFRIEGNHVWARYGAACAVHNNTLYEQPGLVYLKGNTLLAGAVSGRALSIGILGSGRADRIVYEGNTLHGTVLMNVTTWGPSSLPEQPANHIEVEVTGFANSRHLLSVSDAGEALRITSATTSASSSVIVSGDAVKDLFGDGAGDIVHTRAGAAGLAGLVYGWGDVSTLGTSMGARLGDCSSTSKTLTVTVDGGAPIDVVFSTDLTAETNSNILTTINAALGSAATADTFSPGALTRPRVTDEEGAFVNNTGGAILRGSVLAWDGDRDTVRLMTSADAANLFAGVAIEDIPDQEAGRVKVKGYLGIDDVLRSDSGSLTFGATMSVGSTAGAVEVGGSMGLLEAISADAVLVG